MLNKVNSFLHKLQEQLVDVAVSIATLFHSSQDL